MFVDKCLPTVYTYYMNKFGTEYHRKYWLKRRRRITDHLGGKCVKCGSEENLEVDHIDPNLKSFNVSYRCSLNKIKEELKKCQLLCKQHHREKTAIERTGFTHGSMYAWMKKKCKCNICDSARLDWHKFRNQKRRKSACSPIRQEASASNPEQC